MFAQSPNFILILFDNSAKTDIFESQFFDLANEAVKSNTIGQDSQFQFDPEIPAW